ncbi:hypothetical protein GGI12_002850 [Dipsacomyces acuminosporus]|nr:hypothetical protein GGI12_002850 [Dipsacomyces acuminosporus]
MASISEIAYVLYVLLTVSAKSTFQYILHGPRLPNWDLRFQVRRDIMNYFISHGMPQLKDDDGIEKLDIYQLTSIMRAKALQETQLPEGQGIYRASDICVADVKIDASLFKGIGVAEGALVELADTDKTGKGCERAVAYEVVAATAAVDALNEHSDKKDILLSCRPVHKDERVVLYFHGGGYVAGSPASHRSFVAKVSRVALVRVVPIDYRVTPQNPFPAQLHDGFIAYTYLMQQGFKPENIVFAGDSAGAHLALALVHILRHAKVAQPGALVLLSPWADVVTAKPSLETNSDYDYLVMQPITSPLAYARMYYAPGRPFSDEMKQEMKDHLVSPIYGNFEGFPPTLIQAGAKEILIDDITDLYHTIKHQNPDSPDKYVFEAYADMNHAFQLLFDREESTKAIANIGDFIRAL